MVQEWLLCLLVFYYSCFITYNYFTCYRIFCRWTTKGRFKRTVIGNVVAFFGVFLLGTVFIFTSTANAAVADTATISSGLGLIAAGLAIGLSCIGSGYAVASSASAALGALSEDSSVFGKALIFVALAEGIALWGFIVAFLILTHVA